VLMALTSLRSTPLYAICLVPSLAGAIAISLVVVGKVNYLKAEDAPRSSVLLYLLAVSLYAFNTLLMNPHMTCVEQVASHDLSFADRLTILACILALFPLYYALARTTRLLAWKRPKWTHKVSPQTVLFFAGLAALGLIFLGLIALAPSLVFNPPEVRTDLPHPDLGAGLDLEILPLVLALSAIAGAALYLVYWFRRGLSRARAFAIKSGRYWLVRLVGLLRDLPKTLVICLLIAAALALLALGVLEALRHLRSSSTVVEKPAPSPGQSAVPRPSVPSPTSSPTLSLPPTKTKTYPSYSFTVVPLSCSPVAWRLRSTTEIGADMAACDFSAVTGSEIVAVGSASTEGSVRTENIRAGARARRLAALLAPQAGRLHVLNLGKLDDDQPPSVQRQLTIITAEPDFAAPTPMRFDEQLSVFLRSDYPFTSGSHCLLYDAPKGKAQGRGLDLHCSGPHLPR